MPNAAVSWLLETGNPAIQHCTKTELLGQEDDPYAAFKWIADKLPEDWYRAKGLWYVYYVKALAECGLDRSMMPPVWFEAAMERLGAGSLRLSLPAMGLLEAETAMKRKGAGFDFGCEAFLLLQALVSLGFGEEPEVQRIFATLPDGSLPDGGFLCERRKSKLDYVPKSRYKADYYALRLCACCRKKGIALGIEERLVSYFLGRNLLFRRGEPDRLVLDDKAGWRNADAFYPFEPMRVGIQNIMETVSDLGYGNAPEAAAGWQYLNATKDSMGRVILAGTMTRSYLPKEKVGKPSLWAIFYALLAEKERGELHMPVLGDN